LFLYVAAVVLGLGPKTRGLSFLFRAVSMSLSIPGEDDTQMLLGNAGGGSASSASSLLGGGMGGLSGGFLGSGGAMGAGSSSIHSQVCFVLPGPPYLFQS
jgi:hypothetical protein